VPQVVDDGGAHGHRDAPLDAQGHRGQRGDRQVAQRAGGDHQRDDGQRAGGQRDQLGPAARVVGDLRLGRAVTTGIPAIRA
jgi:hypothetical protein